MLVKSNCRTPFLGLPAGNCDFLKEITLFRYSPIDCIIVLIFLFVYRFIKKPPFNFERR